MAGFADNAAAGGAGFAARNITVNVTVFGAARPSPVQVQSGKTIAEAWGSLSSYSPAQVAIELNGQQPASTYVLQDGDNIVITPQTMKMAKALGFAV